jgi:hypothetical protein
MSNKRVERLSRVLYQGLIEYETPRLVKVHNIKLGIVIRISQMLVIAYVISYAIIYERGYQVRTQKVLRKCQNFPKVPFSIFWQKCKHLPRCVLQGNKGDNQELIIDLLMEF